MRVEWEEQLGPPTYRPCRNNERREKCLEGEQEEDGWRHEDRICKRSKQPLGFGDRGPLGFGDRGPLGFGDRGPRSHVQKLVKLPVKIENV